MKVNIRFARHSDLKKYTDLLQKTYQYAYTNRDLRLDEFLFSKEVFNSFDTQEYLKSNLKVNDRQKTWLAFIGADLIGSVTITDKGEKCELRGFYVSPEYQGRGIGKKLWSMVLKFASGKEIVLDIYAHNVKTIEMYKRWGFEVDKEKGVFYRHWPEWPEGIRAKSIYMRYRQKS